MTRSLSLCLLLLVLTSCTREHAKMGFIPLSHVPNKPEEAKESYQRSQQEEHEVLIQHQEEVLPNDET